MPSCLLVQLLVTLLVVARSVVAEAPVGPSCLVVQLLVTLLLVVTRSVLDEVPVLEACCLMVQVVVQA